MVGIQYKRHARRPDRKGVWQVDGRHPTWVAVCKCGWQGSLRLMASQATDDYRTHRDSPPARLFHD